MRGTARGMMTATCLAAACLLALAAGARAEMHPQLAGMNTVHTHGDTGVASLHTARPIAEAVLGSEDARASDDPTSEHGAGGDLPQAELGAGAADFASRVSPDFEAFVQTHKKAGHTYCPGSSAGVPCIEAMRRELSFLENKALIERHNSRGDSTFKLGLTPFADVSPEEFVSEQLTYTPAKSVRDFVARRRSEALTRAASDKGVGQTVGGVIGEVSRGAGRLGEPRARTEAELGAKYPRNFDWADVPEVMGKIHTQETSCASCWAYTSTDTIEAIEVISGRRKKHVELSAEQLINCDNYDSGCNTGNMFTAYEWIHEHGGLATARAFHGAAGLLARAESAAMLGAGSGAALGSFRERVAAVREKDAKALIDQARDEGNLGEFGVFFEESLGAEEEKRVLDSIESGLGSTHGNCPANMNLQDRVYGYCELNFDAGEAALMEAVSKQPVAVGINANKIFQLYASGIIRSSDCGPAPHTPDSEIMAINHAVVVTGWGEEMVKGELIKYWILKNSFGENWGEHGYFKLERGPDTVDQEGFGTCGLYFESVYPIIDEDANEDSCIKGSTFRSKYYSAAYANAGLGKSSTLSMRDFTSANASAGVGQVAVMLVGFGFVTGILVVSVFLAVRAARKTLTRGTEEEPLL